jgi:hypothetical protein
MFENVHASSFHNALLYDLTQKRYSHITGHSQHYHVKIVHSRKKYIPHSNIFLTTTLMQLAYFHNILGSLVTSHYVIYKSMVSKFDQKKTVGGEAKHNPLDSTYT